MEYYQNEALKRCYDIVTEYGGIEEFLKRIEESINDAYSKEQCYKDILENAEFNISTITEFIKHIILSGNRQDINIIMQNLELLEPNVFSELMLYLKTNYKCKEFLKNEIRKGIISSQDLSKVGYFIYDFLKSEEDGKQIIEERFEDFLSCSCDFRFIINQILKEMEIPEERVLENKRKILENARGEDIILYINWFIERGCFNDKDIKLEDFIKALHSNIEDKITLKMLEIIYKELMDKQGLDIKDIKISGKGAFNSNYRIGQFVLKIGETRRTKRIPYHRRILQPIIRQDTNPNKESNLYIEIQNVVDNKWYEGMNEQQIQEELYKIYKEMREDGAVWTDIKKENIGRLIKPNKSNYYTETLEGNINQPKNLKIIQKELEISDNSVGIINRKKEESLQPGDLVVLDTDYIFKIEDIDFEQEMKINYSKKYIEFERRYRYEKKQVKSQR